MNTITEKIIKNMDPVDWFFLVLKNKGIKDKLDKDSNNRTITFETSDEYFGLDDDEINETEILTAHDLKVSHFSKADAIKVINRYIDETYGGCSYGIDSIKIDIDGDIYKSSIKIQAEVYDLTNNNPNKEVKE